MTALPPRLGNAELADSWQLPRVAHQGRAYGLLASLAADGTRIRLGLMSLGGPTRLLTATADIEWPNAVGAVVLRSAELHASLREAGIVSTLRIPCAGLGTAVLSALTAKGQVELERQTRLANDD